MPEKAAENFARAVERVRDQSLTAEQHSQAVDELLEANARLLSKQGVDVQGPRRAVAQVVSGALLVAVIVAMVLLVTYSKEGADTAAEAKATATIARETVHELRRLQRGTVVNQRKGCERANDDREGEVKNLRSDAAVEQAQLNLWNAALAEATPEELEALEGTKAGDALDRNIEVLEKGISRKRASVKHKIESQKAVAVEPGSPRADCDKAYPLHKPAAVLLEKGPAFAPGSGPFRPLRSRTLELASAER